MSLRSLFLLVASVPLLAGCDEVVTSSPLGETPVAVSEDDWEGMWVSDGGAIAIKVLDEARGELLVSFIEPDKEPPTVEPIPMTSRAATRESR